MHEEAADRGSRRAAEFTPHLEQAPSCHIPLLSLSPASRLSLPLASHFASSGTSSIFSSWSSSSSCLPASLTPRGQNGRCTRSYLPAASLWSTFPSPPSPRPYPSRCLPLAAKVKASFCAVRSLRRRGTSVFLTPLRRRSRTRNIPLHSISFLDVLGEYRQSRCNAR